MASIRKHPVSGTWQVRYRTPDGVQATKTFKRKIDASAFAEDIETDKRRGTYIDQQAGATTFSDYADRWLATRIDKAQSTRDRDRSYLRSLILPHFGSRRVTTIQTSEIGEWVASMGRADATRSMALQIVRSVMELARRDRAIVTNPAVDVKSPGTEPERVGQVLEDADIALLLEASEDVDESIAGVVWLMARAGLRIGEALAVQRSDIDFGAGTLTVQRTLTRKGEFKAPKGRKRGDQGRTIPMPPDLTDRLRVHVEQTSILSIDGLLFTGGQGRPLSYTNWLKRKWNRITEAAGVDAVPHDLRHTVATRLMVVDRWSPAEVQHFLGHRDSRVTLAIYTHISSVDLPVPSRLNAR